MVLKKFVFNQKQNIIRLIFGFSVDDMLWRTNLRQVKYALSIESLTIPFTIILIESSAQRLAIYFCI